MKLTLLLFADAKLLKDVDTGGLVYGLIILNIWIHYIALDSMVLNWDTISKVKFIIFRIV